MPLRNYIETHGETVQDIELAGTDKLWEGIELLVAGRPAGGIYLLGYVAEMVLKNACFLFDKARPADLIWPRLAPMRNFGKKYFPTIDPENYHSLVFWYHALQWKRNIAKQPLPRPMARQLARKVARIYSMWIVAMRYYPDVNVLPNESEAVYRDVIWLYDNQLQLRS